MLIALLLFSTIFLAYTNGANDNFKGVATLYGSGVLGYKTAISIATATTFLGSICAIFLAQGLIASFSGKGLVPQDVAGTSGFLISVGFGAACTVLLATFLGFPISTTHSLVGGLLGAGVMAVGLDVNFYRLGGAFFLPLLASPFIAFALGMVVYWFFRRMRKTLELTKESCICIGEQKQLVPITALPDAVSNVAVNIEMVNQANPKLMLADESECIEAYTDRVWGIYVQKLLDAAHIVSAAAVSFARGLNDTPKIAGLLVAAQAVDIRWGMVAIAVGMAIGGLLSARRVAETMSKKITEINHGQGFSANLVTSFLVIVASKYGVPVSTTHVSVGSIFGIGMVSGNRNAAVIKSILLSWLITLPIAMVFSASIYWLLF
ncbi:anion permease [Pseudomonadota bacterium]